MRVALVHDWLTGMRGGEKVLLSLARLYPSAPIFTLLHLRGSLCPELEAREIRTTFVQRFPGLEAHYRSYLPLFPLAVSAMDFSDYDLVVSSSHCVAKAARPRGNAVHLCYSHTPMRYVWDRCDDYFGPARLGAVTRWFVRPVVEALRAWDVATAPRVHRFAANSAFVAGRIWRYYGRHAEVIPPPVDTDFFTPAPGNSGSENSGGYDLVVSALVPYKRVELVFEAYRATGRSLKVVGSGPEEARLRAIMPAEVQLLGRVDDAALRELYRNSRAVIMPGVEDFGIVPLEAMACGRPAVVYGEGGGVETVTAGETGLVFHQATAASLRAAVDSLESMRFNTAALRARAEGFSRSLFEARFLEFAERALREAHTLRGADPPW